MFNFFKVTKFLGCITYLVGPLLQSLFRPCYLGCGSNRICLQNYLVGDLSLIYILTSLWVYYLCLDILLRNLTSRRFTRVPPISNHHLFSTPDVTSRVVNAFTLSVDALLLVLRGSVCKIACKIDLVPWC